MESNQDRQEIRQRLQQVGLKATPQRLAILEALAALHGTHPTAEEVFQRLHAAQPGLSLGTVYKTLDAFVKTDLVNRVFSESSKRYDLNQHTHNHIYCTNTQEMVDYTDPDLDRLIGDFLRSKNFQNFNIQHFSVQLVGTKPQPDQQIIIN